VTQAISADQPISSRIERVGDLWRAYVDPAWFRYFVDLGDVDLTQDVSGILPVANGGTGVATSTGTGSVVLSNSPTFTGTASFDVILSPPMTSVIYQNAWADFGAPWATVAYYKDSMNVVHLRGMMTAGVIAATAFTLPAGFRPLANEYFSVASNGAFASVFITPAGDVTVQVGSNVWVSLSGVSFRTDA
jgi:hypothetical protein